MDLYTPQASDAPELKKVRDEQYLTLLRWIENHWRDVSKAAGKTWNPLKFLLSQQ